LSDRLQSGSNRWFRAFGDVPVVPSMRAAVVLWAVGVTTGGLFYSRGHRALGAAVWALSSALTLAAAISPAAHRAIQTLFGLVGRSLGLGVSVIFLAPVFFLVLPVVRFFGRLRGSDPFCRRAGYATLWQESASDERKTRVIGDTFAAERFPAGESLRGLTLALVLLVAGTELVARVMGLGNPVLYVNDPVVGYYPAPDQHLTRMGGARVETNQFGMRAPDYPREKPAGAFRILALGDSTLWGTTFVDQDEIYARRLERLLRARYPGRELQVLNVAANAWGPFHELGYVEKFGTFGADLALICLPAGDLWRPKYGLASLPYFSTWAKPHLALEEEFRSLAWRYIGSTVGPYSAEGLRYQAARGVEAYATLAGKLQRQGIEVMAEVLPTVEVGYRGQDDATEAGLVEQLRAGLAPLGVEVDYPRGLFREKGTRTEIYQDVIHLNPKGNAIYAEYLAGQIERGSRKVEDWDGASWTRARGGALKP
jgi:hypothetical protein